MKCNHKKEEKVFFSVLVSLVLFLFHGEEETNLRYLLRMKHEPTVWSSLSFSTWVGGFSSMSADENIRARAHAFVSSE